MATSKKPAGSTPSGAKKPGSRASGPDGDASWSKPAPKGRAPLWKRLLLFLGLPLFLLTALLILLLPTIASSIATGMVGSIGAGTFHGSASAQRIQLSWRGPQEIRTLSVKDAAGLEILRADARVSSGLLGLLFGSRDLGQIKLSGSALVIRDKDGTLNFAKLFQSPTSTQPPTTPTPPARPAGTPKPIRLPDSLAASLVIDAINVTYVDYSITPSTPSTTPSTATPAPTSAAIGLWSLKGKADFAINKPLVATLAGEFVHGRTAETALRDGGTLAINATINNLTSADGTLTPTAAQGDLSVALKSLSSAGIDALLGQQGRLTNAFGPRIGIELAAKGSATSGDATLTATSDAINADLALAFKDRAITLPRPGTITLDTQKLSALAPDVAARLSDEKQMVLQTWPDVTATLSALSIRLPDTGKPLDLRKSALTLGITTTQAAGKVAIPGPTGGPSASPSSTTLIRPFSLTPLSLTLDTKDLAEGLSLVGGTNATIDNQPAGTLAIDARASGLLDQRGAPIAGIPSQIDARIDLKDFATAIAEPLVPALVRLAQDVGPTLSTALVTSVTTTPGQQFPAASASLRVDSTNIKADANLSIRDNVLTTGAQGITLAIASAGPLAERALANAGLRINSGAAVEASVTDVRVDLSRLTASDAPDLRAAAALISLTLGKTSGSMKLTGEEAATPFNLEPFTLAINASNLAETLGLRASGSATLAGQPAGTLRAELNAAILDAKGAPISGIPSDLSGTFSLLNASTRALQPFVASTGIILAEDIGETLNIEGWAKPAPGAPSNRTDVSLSANAQKLQIAAQLDLSPTEFRTREQGVVVTLQQAGRLLGRFMPPEQATFQPTGNVRLLAQGLAIPRDPTTGTIRPDKAAAQISLALNELRAALIGPDGSRKDFGLTSSRVALTLVPDGRPNIGLESQMAIDGKPSVAKGNLKLNDLFNADGTINAVGARPDGTIELNDVPTALAALGGKDLATLVGEALGQTVSAKLSATPDRQEASAVTIDASITAASGTTLNAGARMKSDEISVGAINARANVSPRLLAALAKDNPAVPRLSAPASFDLATEPFVLPLKGKAVDAARLAGKRVKATIGGSASVADIIVGQGAEQMRTGPVALQGLRIVADLPLTVMAPGATTIERATATINATLQSAGAQPDTLAALVANADLGLRGPTPDGATNLSARLDNVSTAFVDRFIKQPDMLKGSVGERFQIATSVSFPKFPSGEDLENLTLNARLNSERVSMSEVATVRLKPDRIELAKPVVIDWTPSAAWATRYMLGDKPEARTAQSASPMLRFTQPVPVKLTLTRATIATGKDPSGTPYGPMRPGIFDLQTALGIATMSMAMADGTPIALRDINANLAKSAADPSAIDFQLRTVPITAGVAGQPVTFNGLLARLADRSGTITADAAELTAKGKIAGLPTTLVDALAQQNGLLVELLGPIVNVDLDADKLSKQAGRLSALLTSERTTATVRGVVRNGLFIADASTGAELKIVTPQLGAIMTEGLPLVASVEKRTEDGPATLKMSKLELPLSNQSPEDLRRLNGDITLSLGTMRFETGGAFQRILKATGQRQQGSIGRRVEPLHVVITDGVVKYDRFGIPLGEFTVDTEGTYDLVTKKIDLITWIPAGAVADEAAGLFNTGLGSILGGAVSPIEQLTLLPFRTKGTVGGKLDTSPDPKLFLETTGKNLLKPGQLLDGGVRDILDRLPGRK